MTRRNIKRTTICCLTLGLFGAAQAQEEQAVELEPIVITATREEELRRRIPASLTVINRRAIEQTSGEILTDVLSRNAAVDVIKYPGGRSGIGIRGFFPEFGGTSKHSLLLVDGRPSGATNLSTLLKEDIERIEILRGPASALYGSEAMGGVVNVITRKSGDSPRWNLSFDGGSFGRGAGRFSSGGGIPEVLDYDISVSGSRQEDFRVGGYGQGGYSGSGFIRPFTGFEQGQMAVRIGRSLLADRLRVDVRGDLYISSTENAGALPEGETKQGLEGRQRDSFDFALKIEPGSSPRHRILARGYRTKDGSNFQTRPNATKERKFVKSFETQIDQVGLQLQDTYHRGFSGGFTETTAGLDWNSLKQPSKSFFVNDQKKADGTPKAPFSPDYSKSGIGLFAEERMGLLQERLILTVGIRYDRYTLETLHTPLKFDFTPGTASNGAWNPRGGILFRILKPLSLHGTAGTAFVTPTASQMAGYAESIQAKKIFVTRGNPNLRPENSLTWDAGLTWIRSYFRMDATYFDTRVHDAIQTVVLGIIDGKTESTYKNLGTARMRGVETELDYDVAPLFGWKSSLALFSRYTWLAEARDEAAKRDILNVAEHKLNYGVSYDDRKHLSSRLSFRSVSQATDFDFYAAGLPLTTRAGFWVADLNLSWRFNRWMSLGMRVDNLLDSYYEEKKEFPMPGRAISIVTRLAF